MSLFIVSGGTGNCTGGRWTVVGNVSIPNTRVLNVSYDYIALYGSLVLEGLSTNTHYHTHPQLLCLSILSALTII
jgi:hypothetical protein